MDESVASRSTTPRRLLLVVAMVVLLAGCYGLPFYGFPLSMGLPLLTHVHRQLLWPAVSRRASLILSVLAWLGLWLPALVYFSTGLSLVASSPVEQSTAWLLIPLCGPVAPWTTFGPAAAAGLACLVGLLVTSLRRSPWSWLAATWAAPWVHQLVLQLLPNHEFIC